MPDFSKPPPGFPPPGAGLPPMPGPGAPGGPFIPTDLDLTPSVPYYDLPAGLMAPLVKVGSFYYILSFWLIHLC